MILPEASSSKTKHKIRRNYLIDRATRFRGAGGTSVVAAKLLAVTATSCCHVLGGREPHQTAATCGSWVWPQGSAPISGSWRISASPSQPGMCFFWRSMKRSVHSIMSFFDLTSKIA